MFSRNQLQAIFNHVEAGFLLLDVEGLVVLMNPRIEHIVGLSPEAMMGRRLLDLLDDETLDIPARMGYTHEVLISILHDLGAGRWIEEADGFFYEYGSPRRRFIRRYMTPVAETDSGALGGLFVFHDDTEMHDLRQAQEEISSMIVHDLRSPLTAVTASLRLLREIADPADPLGKTVLQTTEISGRAVRKLLTLVNSLLDVAKLESGVQTLERESIHVRAVAQTIMDEFAPLSREMDVAVRYDAPPDVPPIHVDADKIERVLYNLLDNAIKFTPGGGDVTIRVHPPEDDGFLRIDIQDTGLGIPQRHRAALFDRYQQLSDTRAARRRGTGIGLAYCKLAVEAHGGRIWIEDNPAGGSIFAFTLPIMP
ncbi:MAG: ATP-binding protein [Anaerolineales bacterium]